jgi:hypothetical protein
MFLLLSALKKTSFIILEFILFGKDLVDILFANLALTQRMADYTYLPTGEFLAGVRFGQY